MAIENSSARCIEVFFYGLYMDPEVLAGKGVTTIAQRRAVADGFALRVGHKATMLREAGSQTPGMLHAITHADLAALYESIPEYRPEALIARTESGQPVPALTMVLLDPPIPNESNPEYELKLEGALRKLGLASG